LDDDKIVYDVNKIVKTFHQSIEPNLKHGTFENVVTVNLYEKRINGTSTTTNRDAWEKWSIKVNVHFAENEKESVQFRHLAEKQLRACLLYIASLNISEIVHLPFLATADDKSVHSYKISVENANHSESWTSLLKKMISDSAIPSILK
jgi:hypothetical protein